ncbi:hypothetical protein ACFLIM_50195 [Nonomuraea sp. M3C6]|uniref:Uncharacterized protein n=1 Tax=Nonomuraea marmarensis TaxID=3351344 RepID=A0ABW7AVA3_9ACTN
MAPLETALTVGMLGLILSSGAIGTVFGSLIAREPRSDMDPLLLAAPILVILFVGRLNVSYSSLTWGVIPVGALLDDGLGSKKGPTMGRVILKGGTSIAYAREGSEPTIMSVGGGLDAEQLGAVLAEGLRGDAVELFMRLAGLFDGEITSGDNSPYWAARI